VELHIKAQYGGAQPLLIKQLAVNVNCVIV